MVGGRLGVGGGGGGEMRDEDRCGFRGFRSV